MLNKTIIYSKIHLPNCRLSGLIFFCLLSLSAPLYAVQITLNVADVAAPSFTARGIKVVLAQEGSAEFSIDELHMAEKIWRKVHIYCTEFLLNSAHVTCHKGKLDVIPDLPFTFSYEFSSQQLELQFTANANELWQVSADFRAKPWRATALLRNAQSKRLTDLLPSNGALPKQGTLNGTLVIHGDKAGVSKINADLQLADLAATDASGLHAAEKLSGKLHINADRAGQKWNWRGALDWQGGELFWQPLYLRGGHTLQASGQWDGAQLQVTQAVVNLPEVGKIELNALWDIKKSNLLEGHLVGENLSLANGFANYAKPFMEQSILSATALKGRADVDWQYRNGTTQVLLLQLHDVAVEDGEKRFALHGLNADIPWHAQLQNVAHVAFTDGELMGLPLGATQWQIQMRGMDFTLPTATLPLLDGKLEVSDFHIHNVNNMWQWSFSSTLTSISMQKLSAALHWPEMYGSLSGFIPKMSYLNKLLKVDGTLLFRVFDGTVLANNLELFDPFGRAPRLSGNLDMRELDLDLLTRTFSFGNIQGRIDLGVNNLELVNWLPVRFDAKLASSPGKYRKKISQKAVENISSLGGAGGIAALQRSFLRIFENFGYDRIGLSCMLQNDICTMGGVENNGNVYTIVKGGGIPAITVIGYNRKVHWSELLNRLKRVSQDNKAVIK
ncbi:AsmA family protein [Candidatus Nitrotoga sp. HW29]|uniref:AsmA family protein n=1 Tax=Candidatus Nitrotoga sp. HW29 TaxID=2886963 RepID=UPI001EF1E53B|nr:AsmA family protein [Candidatus Nitrotoga sp. HW29]